MVRFRIIFEQAEQKLKKQYPCLHMATVNIDLSALTDILSQLKQNGCFLLRDEPQRKMRNMCLGHDKIIH